MTGPSDSVVVTALGMVTSLGRDVVTSCAAARAGLSQTSELKSLDFRSDELFGRETLDGPPAVFGHTVRGVADGFSGPAKALLLGGAALDDLLGQRPLSDRERSRTGVVLNLSDHFILDADARVRGAASIPSADWRRQTEGFHIRLATSRGIMPPPAHQVLHHGGHAGVALAVQDALAMIARGHVDRCLVGAVDSRAEARFLAAAARLNLLRTVDNPVGLIAGEAAAFFLLERHQDAVHAGLKPIAVIATAVTGRDPVDLLSADHPPMGMGLAQMLRAALARAPAAGFLIGDLNGTSRRAVEWGYALLRLRAERAIDGLPAWFPASSFGDTGAAAGAVGVCVAARAFVRGYAPGNTGVVWLSSESGAKGAIVLCAPKD